MKLTFKINTASESHIIKPDYSNLNVSLNNDNGKGIYSVSGSINVFGADNVYWDSETEWDVEIYHKGILLFTCEWEYNNVSENISFNSRTIELKATSLYTDTWMSNIDKEYNINEMSFESFDLNYTTDTYQAEAKETPVLYTSVSIDYKDLSAFEIVGWDIAYSIYINVVSSSPYLYNVYLSYKRAYSYGFYSGTNKYDPDGVIYTAPTSEWLYIEDVVFEDRTLPKFQRLITPVYVLTPPTSEPHTTILNNASYDFTHLDIDYSNVCRRVDDTIIWLLGKMGSSVLFDSTGTTTDSFYSFKTITGNTYLSNNKPYSDLLLMNLTDFIPADDNGQKDVPAEITMLSLKTLLDYFESIGFEWFIEDRSGLYYFILRHKEQKTLSFGNPDLTNYYNKNRTYLANKYTKSLPTYRRITNKTTCKNIDFVGTDVDFYNVYTTESTITINDSNIYVDLNDITTRREDVYSETDNNNIVLISAHDSGSKYYVRSTEGKRSRVNINNSELSFSYLSEELMCDYASSEYNVNGANLTADNYRVSKTKKYEFSIPINSIKDFDVSKYISIFDNEAEIDSIEQDAKDNIGNLKLKI